MGGVAFVHNGLLCSIRQCTSPQFVLIQRSRAKLVKSWSVFRRVNAAFRSVLVRNRSGFICIVVAGTLRNVTDSVVLLLMTTTRPNRCGDRFCGPRVRVSAEFHSERSVFRRIQRAIAHKIGRFASSLASVCQAVALDVPTASDPSEQST